MAVSCLYRFCPASDGAEAFGREAHDVADLVVGLADLLEDEVEQVVGQEAGSSFCLATTNEYSLSTSSYVHVILHFCSVFQNSGDNARPPNSIRLINFQAGVTPSDSGLSDKTSRELQ